MPDGVSDPRSVFLDELTPLRVRVGFGQLGTRGSLGYEGKRVVVQNRAFSHALSAHPPSRLLYQLDGRYGAFSAEVAINDDVGGAATQADFSVIVDGVRAGQVRQLRAGEAARRLSVELRGAQCLELVVDTTRWDCCHAVWLEPRLEIARVAVQPSSLQDCLRRADITLPKPAPRVQRCIATVVSDGYESLADDMLGSLLANGGCQDALLVLMVLGQSPACLRLAAKYGAMVVRCRPLAALSPMSKAVLYSLAGIVDAEHYLCLDADMLVLGCLRPVFAALEACPNEAILAVREANGTTLQTVGDAFLQVYGGTREELADFASGAEAAYPLVVNDGLFAASRNAMLALDATIRAMAGAAPWIDQRRDIWWRNQFIFNLAVARLGHGVELDGAYNVQLHAQDVSIGPAPSGVAATWRDRPVRVLHLSGAGKRKYPEWRGVYATVPDPLALRAVPDYYQDFLDALRGWIGRYGLRAMAWSFYGTADAKNGRVNDTGSFPLFAALHALLRANGCVRVVETGTARGVSAACMASAIAHRAEPRLVTFDPTLQPEANDLWAALPHAVRSVIEPRATGSLEGMRASIEAGEGFDAALLDSIHSTEHVWAEFELVKQLVCPGGLILIHDAVYAGGTVAAALRRIEAAGYGVTRLWTAESGVSEDDGLGLAVIENRPRP